MAFKRINDLKKIGLDTTKKVAKSTFIDTKNKEKTLGNFYTGKKLNPKHLAIGGGAFLGASTLKSSFEASTTAPIRLATMNDYQRMGASEIMSYDGVGQEPTPQNLNAHGSLVFGLHAGRKG